ncbi:hypothetical protein [Terriglobus tenax]|uniref:hypothetical protein n=1 Tax=Terriglobus tenax TaxID=1111115 RepID=UPI0021DFACD9|nr:hypothetical protein [Terriglobus tenax]
MNKLLVVSGILFASLLPSGQSGRVYASSSAHNLTLANAIQSTDKEGRTVFVTRVTGDLPGTLTLRLNLSANGTITGGEWALNVTYIEFGPISADGDHEEYLITRGVLKGSVTTGGAIVSSTGKVTDLSGLQLSITGATREFSQVSSGTGSGGGSQLNVSASSNGYLSLNF